MAVGLLLVALVAVLLARELEARRKTADAIFVQREWLATTLRSIGDGVIVADPEGRVQMMNPVAEKLTGWSEQEARGRELGDVFNIINESTRAIASNPVARAIAEGHVVGLANHTVLRSRDGREFTIEDSAAPTFARDGTVQGA